MIDVKLLEEFKGDFKKLIKELENKYELVIELGTIHYSSNSFSVKIEAKEGSDKDDVLEREFRTYCYKYGLKPSDYGRQVYVGAKKYTIVGIAPSRSKYPIILEDSTGKRVLCTVGALDFADNED